METIFSNLELLKLKGDINMQTRCLMHNILSFFDELKSDPTKVSLLNLNKPQEIAAFISGVTVRTIGKIKKEVLQEGLPSTPRKMLTVPAPVTNLDDFDVDILKRIVSSHYDNGEYPIPITNR